MIKLVKDNWTIDDVLHLNTYLESIKRSEKIEWTKNIVSTSMKVLAILLPDLKKIAKEIFKGNYQSFLDLMPNTYFESLIIDAFIISFIKDYKEQIKYINRLTKYIDSWSVTDTLKFSIKNHEDEYLEYAVKLIQSKETYKRRTGVRILFSYIKLDDYLDSIYDLLDSLKEEKEYYVNMAAAWLLCELMIKRRNETFKYLDRQKTNSFIINKGISKCRDSFRVSDEDKELLLKYKIK